MSILKKIGISISILSSLYIAYRIKKKLFGLPFVVKSKLTFLSKFKKISDPTCSSSREVNPEDDLKSKTSHEDNIISNVGYDSMVQILKKLNADVSNTTQSDAEFLKTFLDVSCEPSLLKNVTHLIVNSCGFHTNHDVFFEVDILQKMINFLNIIRNNGIKTSDVDDVIVSNLMNAIGNLSLNEKYIKHFEEFVPILHDFSQIAESKIIKLASLKALTNISAQEMCVHRYSDTPLTLFENVCHSSYEIRLQSLKILLNLSTYDSCLSFLLITELPNYILLFFSPSEEEDILLRWLTFLSNVSLKCERKSEILSTLKANCLNFNLWHLFYDATFNLLMLDMLDKLNKHSNVDIQSLSLKLYYHVKLGLKLNELGYLSFDIYSFS